MTTYLADLLKDSAYRLDQFKPHQIAALEVAISLKESGNKAAPYVTCIVRGKPIKLTPEEAIRQLYLLVLRDDLGYPVNRMQVEYEVTFGREKKRADICVFDKDKTDAPYILVELKKPKHKDGSRATQHVKAGDVITSTVRPIRRLSAIVDASQEGAVCSSGFVVLNPTAISSATLVTYLRLSLVCELMDLHCSATLYPAFSEKDLLGLPIPKIGLDVQQKVDASVKASRASTARAAQLLDAAKRSVEIAIEDSEAAALAYLKTVAPPLH